MKELIISLFGAYEPVLTVETHVVADTVQTVEVVAAGLAGVDWPWVAGVLLFAIVLYSFLRLVGVLLK